MPNSAQACRRVNKAGTKQVQGERNMATKEFVNPRVAAKHAKREENKRRAIEKREREKVNKELRKALGNPQKLFDDLQEANNVIARLRASVDEEATAKLDALAARERALERVEALLASKNEFKAENKRLTAERNAAKELLDWKEKGDVLMPLAQSKLLCSKLVDSNKELEGQLNEQIAATKAEVEKGQRLWDKVQGLEAERDALKMELSDALGKPPLAKLEHHAGAEQPVRIPPDRNGEAPQATGAKLPDLQPGDEAEAG
jgi:hypothetical protein